MISDYYILTITPSTLAETTDSMGGVTTAWTDGSTFSGRIRTLRGGEQIINESKKTVTTHRLYCPASSLTSTTQRVNDGTNTYEVILLNSPQDRTANHHMEVELRLVG
jgi:head-tail adaptor